MSAIVRCPNCRQRVHEERSHWRRSSDWFDLDGYYICLRATARGSREVSA